MEKRLNAAVVGCGVAGLAVAGLLARAGHVVTIFERAPILGPVGAGVLLQPSGQMVLAAMGLLDEVQQRSATIKRLFAILPSGRQLIDLSYKEFAADCAARGVHRGVLFDVLHRFAVAAGVRVITGVTAAHSTDRLTDESGNDLGQFDLVIAADGSRSTLRENSSLRKWVYEYPHGALWATGSCSAITDELWQVTRGTKILCGLLPIGGGQCTLFWSVRKDELDALRARGISDFKSRVIRICPQAEELLASISSFEEMRFTTYRHVWMPRWHDGTRTIFIGDAAHAMSPHLGQGINLALLDAMALANAINKSDELSLAFERYEKDRRGHVGFYGAVTAGLSPFFQSRGFVKGWGRNIALPIMCGVPFVRRRMVQTMAGMRGGWWGGNVRVENGEQARRLNNTLASI